ncbi:MAG TPA: MFS transporter [Phototrophicaceae bacterium]|jgi:MFS family permease|nr:MFS transporter [Phototrophicaceae bacterium]
MSESSERWADAPSTAFRFRISRFGALWSATAASNLADGIFKLALPLLATQQTNSPGLVAGVALVVRLPWLLFALFAGVLADRLDRRLMMIGANLLRVAVLALLVVVILTNSITLPLLYGIALILGIAETLADTAGSSILPSVVGKSDLERANAHLVGVTTLTNEFIGPPLGGALAALSLGLAFATSSALYLAAAIAILLLTGSYTPAVVSKQHILSDIAVGLRFVWHDKLLRALLIIVGVMNMGWSAWMSIMVLYVVKPGPGGLTEVEFGFMLTSIGIGGLVGTLVAVPLVERFGRKWAIGADIVGTFIMLAIPALTPNAWAIGSAAVIGGVGGAMWSIVVSSIRQQLVPDDMLGRTGGVFRLFGYGALPLGSALAGIVAESVGLPAVFALCAFLTLLLIVQFYNDIVPATITLSASKPQ